MTHVLSACFDNSLAICVSLTCSHQCHRLIHQRPCHVLSCLCDNACKRSLAISVVRVWHDVSLAGFCLSLYSLDMLNRYVNIIKNVTIHQRYHHSPQSHHTSHCYQTSTLSVKSSTVTIHLPYFKDVGARLRYCLFSPTVLVYCSQ